MKYLMRKIYKYMMIRERIKKYPDMSIHELVNVEERIKHDFLH